MKFRPLEVAAVLISLAAIVLIRNRTVESRILAERVQIAETAVNSEAGRARDFLRQIKEFKQLARHSRLDTTVRISGLDLDSNQVNVDFGSGRSPLVLYSIDPSCASCLANMPFVDSIAQNFRVCRTSVIGVLTTSRDKLSKLESERRPSFPVLQEASGTAWEVLPLTVSPHLILIGPSGKFGGWWAGELTDSTRAEITASLATACANSPR